MAFAFLPRPCPVCQQAVPPTFYPQDPWLFCPQCGQELPRIFGQTFRLSSPLAHPAIPGITLSAVSTVAAFDPLLAVGRRQPIVQDQVEWQFRLTFLGYPRVTSPMLRSFWRIPDFDAAAYTLLLQAVAVLGLTRPPVPVLPLTDPLTLWTLGDGGGHATVLLNITSWDPERQLLETWLPTPGRWRFRWPAFRRPWEDSTLRLITN